MKIRNGFVSNSSSSSFSVIALKVDIDKLMKRAEVRNCECEVPNIESMKFCSNCGGPVMRKDDIWISGVDEEGIGKFDFINEDDSTVFIMLPGTYLNVYDYDISMKELPDDIYTLKAELKKITEKLGVWNESNFGIWAGMRGDY